MHYRSIQMCKIQKPRIFTACITRSMSTLPSCRTSNCDHYLGVGDNLYWAIGFNLLINPGIEFEGILSLAWDADRKILE